jgi:hypothetical protein
MSICALQLQTTPGASASCNTAKGVCENRERTPTVVHGWDAQLHATLLAPVALTWINVHGTGTELGPMCKNTSLDELVKVVVTDQLEPAALHMFVSDVSK